MGGQKGQIKKMEKGELIWEEGGKNIGQSS
jgi:hypothetical protein